MIQFKHISILGFRSIIEPLDLDLSNNGLHLLLGPNGSGKTSIVDALYWSIYGKSLKKSTKDKIPTREELRPATWEGTMVALDLHVRGSDYTIIRSIDYDQADYELELLHGGTEIHSRDKADTQKMIDEIIQLNTKEFLSTILLGQKLARFTQASTEDRLGLFDKLFDVAFVNQAKAKARDFVSEIKGKVAANKELQVQLEHKKEKAELTLRHNKEKRANFKTNQESRIAILKSNNEDQKTLLDKLTDKAAEIPSEHHQRPPEKKASDTSVEKKYEKAIAKYNKELQTYASKIAVLESSIEGWKTQVDNKEVELRTMPVDCTKCGQPLDEEALAKSKMKISAEISVAKNQIQDTPKKIAEIESERESVRLKYNEAIDALHDYREEIKDADADSIQHKHDYKAYAEYIEQIAAIETKLKVNKGKIAEIKAEKLVLKKPDAELKEKISECSEQLKTIKKNFAKHAKKQERYEFWYKTGYAASGLKAYVYKHMLKVLNEAIATFATRFGFSIMLDIDIEKTRKRLDIHVSKHGLSDIGYSDLSGGEQTRVDLAVAFGLYTVLASATVDFNLFILDEVFTGLDEEGLHEALTILRDISEEKGVYIITHFLNVDAYNAKPINIKKVNNNTTLC